MKIEEKIARAYHKDLSWRKVLVRLEPDAHNNMVVRRMFANAYGWPVIKHMCDTHFAYTAAAKTRDDEEPATERAKTGDEAVRPDGEEVKGQTDPPPPQVVDDSVPQGDGERAASSRARSTDGVMLAATDRRPVQGRHDSTHRFQNWKFQDRVGRPDRPRTDSEIRESRDDVSELVSRVSATGERSDSFYNGLNSSKTALARLARQDSARWSDRFFEGSDDGDDEEDEDPLLEELNKARRRGELDKKLSDSSLKTSARIANILTSSPESTTLGSSKATAKSPLETDDDGRLVTEPETPLTAEPAELEPLSPPSPSGSSHSSVRTRTKTHVDEPGAVGSVNSPLSNASAQLGLSSLGEHGEQHPGRPSVSPGGDNENAPRRGSVGVAEEVALAQARKQKQREP